MELTAHQIGFFVGYIFILLYAFHIRDKWVDYKDAKKPLQVGILLLVVVVISSIIEQKWDTKHLLDLLMMKKVGRWIIYINVGWAYLFILYGLEIYLIIFIKKLRQKG